MLNASDSWKTTYPGAAAGALIMRGVINATRHPGLDQRITGWEADLRKKFSGSDRATLRALPVLQAYAAYYRRFRKTYHVELQLESVLLGTERRESNVITVRSLALFVLAGLCEIGGGYLVWQWWRNGAPALIGAVGALVLVLYGIVPTYQPAPFGRTYAAYGGIFIVLSLLWSSAVDHVPPDRYDVLGGLLCLAGMGVIMYSPR